MLSCTLGRNIINVCVCKITVTDASSLKIHIIIQAGEKGVCTKAIAQPLNLKWHSHMNVTSVCHSKKISTQAGGTFLYTLGRNPIRVLSVTHSLRLEVIRITVPYTLGETLSGCCL